MKVVPGADGWPESHEYTAGGSTVRFDAEPAPGVRPILHVRLFHPANDHYGMSPIEAAASAIDLHNTAARWNKALLDNSARPSGALVYAAAEGRMTAEQFQRLKAELEQGFQGCPADAARHPGRQHVLQLPRGDALVLAADGAAAGQPDGAGALGLARAGVRRRTRIEARPRSG
jgi:hypothetical protein